jgi:hypothetical protein
VITVCAAAGEGVAPLAEIAGGFFSPAAEPMVSLVRSLNGVTAGADTPGWPETENAVFRHCERSEAIPPVWDFCEPKSDCDAAPRPLSCAYILCRSFSIEPIGEAPIFASAGCKI